MSEKPSTLVSVLAAVSCLAGVPLGFVVVALTNTSLPEAWNEGGWPMYATLLVALVASVVNAVGLFFLTRGSPVAAGFGLFGSLLTGLVGAFGFKMNMDASLQAIAHAAPADRLMLMNGATGESLNCALLGGALVAGLLLSFAMGALVASFSGSLRAAFVLLGLGLVGLALWQAALATGFAADAQAYKARAFADANDTAILYFEGLERSAAARRLGSGALVAVVVAVLGALALLRSQRAALTGVVGALLVTAAGLGGARALAQPADVVLEAFEAVKRLEKPLRRIDGTRLSDKDDAFVLTREGFLDAADRPLSDLDAALASLEDEFDLPGKPNMMQSAFNLRLSPDVELAQVLDALRTLRDHRVRVVRLVGQVVIEPPLDFTPPRPFAPRLVMRSGVVVLLPEPGYCEKKSCEFATLGEALRAGELTLPLKHSSAAYVGASYRLEEAIHFRVEPGLTLEQLLDVAHTAADQEARFVALQLP